MFVMVAASSDEYWATRSVTVVATLLTLRSTVSALVISTLPM
nr:hypothetical protein [Methylobrevis pamukkalensis]